MNILCIDISLIAPALEELGHNVLLTLPKDTPLLNVPAFLREHNFKPDFIIQAESLAKRTLLEGLEELPCPKIFWAIDSHLNMHWHHYYARLFDMVLTPHLSLWQNLPVEHQHPMVRQMTRQGQALPWKNHAQRKHDISFVGVLNKYRPLRTWLCELLAERWTMEVKDKLPFGEMLALYADSRIIPNEAIAFEVNYRLMEGASAGAVVLSPNIGPDQDALFTPEREIMVYNNAAELLEQVETLLSRPSLAEKIGYAAWERVQKEHLPIHRAQFIVQCAEALMQEKEPEEIKEKRYYFQTALWLSQVQTKRSGTFGQADAPLPQAPPIHVPQTEETTAFTLRLLLENGLTDEPKDIIKQLLINTHYPDSLIINTTASFGALKLNDLSLAKQFLYRQYDASNIKNKILPETAGELCLAWSRILMREQFNLYAGFTFNPLLHLPQTAMEAVMLAENSYGKEFEHVSMLEIANNALDGTAAFFRFGYLARLALAKHNNWRVQFDYGILSLICYRFAEGLFELEEAHHKALVQGEDKAYLRLLKVHDHSGAIKRKLNF